DVRAALEAAHDASRGDSVMRLLTGAGIGAADLHVLGAWARELAGDSRADASLVEAVDTPPSAGWRAPSGPAAPPDGRRRVERLGDLLRQVRSLSYLSLPEVVSHTITLLSLDIEVAARAGRVAAHARANLDAFVDVAASFAADTGGAGLGTFLGWLDAADERERGLEPVDADPQPGAGQVLTVHAAKGLAWDGVAVAGLVASQFPSYQGEPTAAVGGGAGLGTFLGWLDAAAERERGLEPVDADPQPGAVQVLTVHGARGLEWDVVAVPGLVESQFPSYQGRPTADGAVSTSGWLTDRTALPYPLRGDAASLPALDLPPAPTHADVREALTALRRDSGRHTVAEERRLAYVAVTRARPTLLLSRSWFRPGKRPLPPSRLLAEPRAAGLVEEAPLGWAPEPAADAVNPSLERVVSATWPLDPLGERRHRLEAAAVAVRTAGPLPPPEESPPDGRRWLRDEI